MLVVRRLAGLNAVVQRIQRLGREELALQGQRRPPIHSDVTGSGGHGVGSEQARRIAALRERLLFRTAPVAVSLVERSLWAAKQRDRRARADAPPRLLSASSAQLPQPAGPVTRTPITGSHWLAVVTGEDSKEEESTIRLHGGGQSPLTATSAEPLLRSLYSLEQERRTLLRHTNAKLECHSAASPAEQQRAHDDLSLLRSSLLARPYLSARLWRMLLHPDVWLPVVQRKDLGTEKGTRLLAMALLMAQLSLGVLTDYVQGGSVNRTSPRFVVSLPSHAYRRRTATAEAEGLKQADSDVTDPLACMLAECSNDADESKQEVGGALVTAGKPVGERIRWLPPHTSEVIPLVLETLALHSFLVPELRTVALNDASRVSDILNLLVTLQKTATATLALYSGDGSNGRRAVLVEEGQLHGVLRRLEPALVETGHAAKDALLQVHATAVGDVRLTPAVAGRTLLNLDSLQLLRPGDRDSEVLLDALLTSIFPQLRTNTYEALVGKARQNTLLAFATQRHREKLHTQQPHQGSAGAEAYLSGTIIQQARLNQRRMAAALRERRLSDTHLQLMIQLGGSMPPHELVSLFQIFALSACDTGARNSMSASASRSLTAVLFTGEALLTTEALQAPSTGRISILRMGDVTRLWTALAVLWPVIDTRREMLRSGQRRGRGGGGGGDERTESVIMGFLSETVLLCLNSGLAERLQQLESVRQTRRRHSGGRNSASDGAIRAGEMASVAMGLVEWTNSGVKESSGGIRVAGRPQAVSQQVMAAGTLLKALLVRDHDLWKEVREWDSESRDRFQRHLTECFVALGMIDAATTEALEHLCVVF